MVGRGERRSNEGSPVWLDVTARGTGEGSCAAYLAIAY
jgi:hypothetical protein